MASAGRAKGRAPGVMFASESEQKPLTRREREVLALISEGCSNKQGALRMNISPRTFESHRAEAMRKAGRAQHRRSGSQGAAAAPRRRASTTARKSGSGRTHDVVNAQRPARAWPAQYRSSTKERM